MPAFFRDDVHDELTQLVGDLLKLLRLEFGPKVRRMFNLRQEGAGGVSVHGLAFKGLRGSNKSNPLRFPSAPKDANIP